jgi:4-amino-4-deoxy-L-arabinose transferase-like glycosyltransferase
MIRNALRAHRAITVVLALFVALGIIYSTTTPLFEAPDEQWHFAFVQHLATGRGLPVQVEPLTHLARQEGSQPPLYYLLAAGATFWIDTPDYPGIVWENPHYGYNVPGIVNDNKNLFIHTSLENFPYRGTVLAIHLVRWLSVLMGALAVLLTYLLALEIFPAQKFLAASAGAVVAFVPQFIFVSSAVSNDSTIVALSALTLWLMTRLLTKRRLPTTDSHQQSIISNRDVIALGAACGLAALAKVSGLGLTALAVLVLAWQIFRQPKTRNAVLNTVKDQKSEILFHFLSFTFAFLLVAGWWYLRNLVLYDELTGTARMNEIFHLRTAPMSLDELLVQLHEVWETSWVGFGWGNIRAQPLVYAVIGIFVATGVIGWALRIRKSQLANRHSLFAILCAWIALMFAALVYWMQTTQAPHGRLFFPALPALAVLIIGGLTQFSISGFRLSNLPFVHLSFIIFLFALATLAPFGILQPAYAYPQTLSQNDLPQIPNRVDISYDDKIELLGYDVSSRRVSPGSWTELTLYWHALATMDEDYSIGIRVVDPNQRVIGARNSYPGHGMLPTRLWYSGQIIRDVYWLPINADASNATFAQIQIVVFDHLSKRDLVARDPRGEIITPFIGQIEVIPK